MSFVLDRPNSPTPTFIFFRKMINGQELKYPTKEKVDPSNWDKKLKRESAEKSSINLVLDKINLIYQNLLLQQKLNGHPLDAAILEEAFDKGLGRQAERKPSTGFYSFIDELIEQRESGAVLNKNGQRFSPNSITAYRYAKSYLFEFDPLMAFHKISIKTYHAFIDHMNKQDYSLNTIGLAIKNWIVFLRESFNEGLHSNKVFDHDDFIIPDETSETIYLELDELNSIYQLQFNNKSKEATRDWFVIGYFTGLRIIDWEVMGLDNIEGNLITLANEKTNIHVTIPKHPFIKAIMKKWGGLPPMRRRNCVRRYLKDIAKEAGIQGKELRSITKGGIRIDKVIDRHQLVTPHTARRSFITNLLEAGVADNIVMQLAGIKKHSTLMRYKKTKPKKTAELMASHPFFN